MLSVQDSPSVAAEHWSAAPGPTRPHSARVQLPGTAATAAAPEDAVVGAGGSRVGLNVTEHEGGRPRLLIWFTKNAKVKSANLVRE